MSAIPPNTGFDASVPLSRYVGGLKAAGVPFVGRYIASDPGEAWKIITPGEAVELAIAGVALFPIYENGEAQSGAGQGDTDGRYAASYLATVGLLPNTGVIIYYAEDFNVQSADMSGISQAFAAFGAALPGYGVGVYSCGYCNAQLGAQGLVVRKWLSASTSYNGTQPAMDTGDYDMLQGLPLDCTINNRTINIDLDTLRVSNTDVGARVPWGGAIPQNASLSFAAIQMLLNKAGQNPPLDPDDVSGALTKAAIIASKRKYGLTPDTSIDWSKWVPLLCRDAGVRILTPAATAAVAMATAASADTIMQRVARLEHTVGASGVTGTSAVVRSSGRAPSLATAGQAPSVPIATKSPPLGPVNGALGETLGNLLNGKKSGIGIIGALLTSMLAQVPPGTGLGQVLTLLTPSAGLSPYAMPICLALAAWGVLGKMEKWTQESAPSPGP
jgi:peptidoglycan hydrolase-like protein with peptidoglycan-binding domain